MKLTKTTHTAGDASVFVTTLRSIPAVADEGLEEATEAAEVDNADVGDISRVKKRRKKTTILQGI